MNSNITKKKKHRMSRLLIIAVIAQLFWIEVQAQGDRTLTGTVRDNNGLLLPGVNVTIKGTAEGTITDAAGRFSLSIPDQGAVVHFSFIGFKAHDEQVTTQTDISISLEPDVTELQDVVIIGY